MLSKKIAWIGAGKMGLPICKRLKSAGHQVFVLARKPEQAGPLNVMGFATESSVPDLIKNADIVFTAVTDDYALTSIVFDQLFVPALSPNSILIDISTVSPEASRQVATHLTKDLAYLRAPVSGSTAMAETGTLTTMVSGPHSAFEVMGDIFAAYTKNAFYVGAAEEARFLKLAINSMVAATSALLGEALAFGAKGGLSNARMLEVFNQSAVASPLIGYKSDMIIKGDYRAAATLDMLKKDVELLLRTSQQLELALPINDSIKKIYDAASTHGLGEQDFFVLVREAQSNAARNDR
jgi:3-hydroxyisobutyrate dehydrogenase-like beta-hydroxyacid dehydrogenase